MKISFLFLCFSSALLLRSQDLKISSADSITMMAAWKQVAKALQNSDAKTIQKFSSPTVECDCGTDSITNEITNWKADKFAVQFIKKYNLSKNLKDVITNEVPHLMVSPMNQAKKPNRFSVNYVVDKPSKVYEGTSIFFDFVKTKSGLKLKSIWTIP
jgi:hypothetical protein